MRTLIALALFSTLAIAGCRSTEPTPVSGGGDAAATAGTPSIRGKVSLSAELQSTLKPTATLYVIARRSGEPAGPPLAVKRIQPPLKFPVDFEISAADMMMPGRSFEGNLALLARVSQGGSAMPVAPGDIEGFPAANLVPVGTQGVEIQLDQVRR